MVSINRLTFRNLPFTPEEDQVIYVESYYDEQRNTFIRDNYDWLRETFSSCDLQFCYLPLLAQETIGYNAPYLTPADRRARAAQVPSLASYLDGGSYLEPSLVYFDCGTEPDADGRLTLHAIPLKAHLFRDPRPIFKYLAEDIQRNVYAYRSLRFRIDEEDLRFRIDKEKDIQYKIKPSSDIRFSISTDSDADFDDESRELLQEFRRQIEALRNRGINRLILHDIIDDSEPLSRLLITRDHRFFLPDYNNLEITMSDLPKAVYLLFLRHPEGIPFKFLPDYFSELLTIYRQLQPIGTPDKQEQSVRDVTDPLHNSINEKCARIREAFVRHFDDRLASHYYITGSRGQAKRIQLPTSMIIWE